MPETALCQEAVSCVSAYDSVWRSFSKDFFHQYFMFSILTHMTRNAYCVA